MNKILMIIGGVVVAVLVVLGGMYAFDAPIGATITDKRCFSAEIDIKTDFGASVTLPDVPPQQCGAIQEDNYVKYHIRSGRTEIFESKGGACIWDTEHGVNGCG